MESKITLPCVIDLDGLFKATTIIPELSLAEIDFDFVMRRDGYDVRCGSVADLKRVVNAWLRRRSKDLSLDRPSLKKSTK